MNHQSQQRRKLGGGSQDWKTHDNNTEASKILDHQKVNFTFFESDTSFSMLSI